MQGISNLQAVTELANPVPAQGQAWVHNRGSVGSMSNQLIFENVR